MGDADALVPVALPLPLENVDPDPWNPDPLDGPSPDPLVGPTPEPLDGPTADPVLDGEPVPPADVPEDGGTVCPRLPLLPGSPCCILGGVPPPSLQPAAARAAASVRAEMAKTLGFVPLTTGEST
jgi:hypothetical protein